MFTADTVKSNHEKYIEREKGKYKEFIDRGLNLEEAKFIHSKLMVMQYDSETEGKEQFTFVISEPNIKARNIEKILLELGFFVKTEWVPSISMEKMIIATTLEKL